MVDYAHLRDSDRAAWRAHSLAHRSVAAYAAAASIAVGAVVAASPHIGIAIVGATALACLFGYSPRITFLGLLICRPLVEDYVHLRVGIGSLGQVWGAALIAVIAFLLVFDFPWPVRGSRSYMPALSFLVLYPLLTLARPGASAAMLNETKAVSWILLILLVERMTVDAAGQRRIIMTAVVMSVTLVGAISYAYATNRYGAAYYSIAGRGGSFDQQIQIPHGLASLAVMLMPFVLILTAVRGYRTPAFALLAALVLGVVLSYVRSAWLGAVVVLFAYIAFVGRRRRVTAFLAVVVAGVSAFVVVDAAQNAINQRISHGAPRLVYWEACIQGTIVSPFRALFGGGVDASYSLIAARIGDHIWSHNDFVEFFTAGGAVLALAYIALIMWMIRACLDLARDGRHSDAARNLGRLGIAACAAYVVISALNGMVFFPASFAMAILIGVIRGARFAPGETVLDIGFQKSRIRAVGADLGLVRSR